VSRNFLFGFFIEDDMEDENEDSLELISSTFIQTFCANILAPKITKLCFGFEIFWHQNIGKKARVKC